MNITLKEIVDAYRKAKVDTWLFHNIDEDAYLYFEQDFVQNVKNFQRFINRPCGQIQYTSDWLGQWRLAPKKILPKEIERDKDLSIASDPSSNFSIGDIEGVSYRLMACPSVAFQILSALWINKVGWKYDARLGRNIYGNRLRPLKNGKPNLAARGSFQSYFQKFKSWKKDGINSLDIVQKNRNAVVVTADAKAFFHCLKPDFLLNTEFLKRNDIRLTNDDKELTKRLIDAINEWASHTPLGKGLPVGLMASCVIANVALLEFDKLLNCIPGLVFYGRYVDDLLIVLNYDDRLKTRSDIWRRIANISEELISNEIDDVGLGKSKVDGVVFNPYYSSDVASSKIVFSGDKCRVFLLDSKTGPSFVSTLEAQMRDITSEFRYLPRSIFENKIIEDKILRLVTKDGDIADNFRKIDALTFQRRELKSLINDMNFLLVTLPPDSWKEQRYSFYRIIKKHIITGQRFFEYAESDIPRIISIATQCGDFDDLSKILSHIDRVSKSIMSVGNVSLSGMDGDLCKDKVKQWWRDEMFRLYARRIRCSYNASGDKEYAKLYDKFIKANQSLFVDNVLPRSLFAKVKVSAYAFHDLAATSLIQCFYQKDIRPNTATCNFENGKNTGCIKDSQLLKSFFDSEYLRCANLLAKHMALPFVSLKNEIPYGILLPTRPLEEKDIICLGEGLLLQNAAEIFSVFRGYDLRVAEESGIKSRIGADVLLRKIENDSIKKPIVALMNLRTTEEMCCDELKSVSPEKLFERFKSVIQGINSIIEKRKDIDYIIIHELALPIRWFIALAKHCSNYSISLISGITYRVTDEKEKFCKNEVWFSLVSGNRSFKRPILLREEKQKFAREEAYWLLKKFSFQQDNRISQLRHSVIKHGEFSFSTLICSELMEVENRSRLCGLIDALFILAWNKDIGAFGSIIESSALDLHAFIVQVNNNVYGDSRIRSPEKESWRRDTLRIRGGLGDNSLVDMLDVPALRWFQQNWDSEVYFDSPRDEESLEYKKKRRFKPMPPGFEFQIPSYRRVIY